ncbi:MAG TPA: mannitol dehydrogenase family protein, partial [Solirubrobacteraceae bacterium]|nr:mannitol dehydrogenase family protein [Solirubrobacteraceae bacterium]
MSHGATVLNTAALPALRGRLPVPEYDRRRASAGVVHIGVGGFHRAHQAVYHDRMMAEHDALEWGICGVGVMPQDRRMRDVLTAQDGLYTLIIKHPDGRYEPRVVGSVLEHLFAPDDPERVVQRLASETTRIVSLTLTEGGYSVDDDSRAFDASRADIARDLVPGAPPQTAFALVTEALARRRQRGIRPFAVVSCDNLVDNGDIARTAFSGFGRLRDPDQGDWIAEAVAFPNSVVDRITPATTGANRDELRRRIGLEDGWPVVCEPFIQWVLEDVNPGPRPPYEAVGVQVLADVRPFEQMKLRLLNAGHQAVAYFGALLGYRLVHEAVRDPLVRNFLTAYLQDEAVATIGGVAPAQLQAFAGAVPQRFSNPAISDTLARLAVDASDRIPKFVLPVIRAQLERNGSIQRATAIIVAWARCLASPAQPLEMADRRLDDLLDRARRDDGDPGVFIAYQPVF